jgi:NADH-quinone oxidoreductase subunit L
VEPRAAGEPEHLSSSHVVNAAPASGAAVHAEAAHEPFSPTEFVLMGLSIAMAIGGMLLGQLVYLKRTELADIWAAKLRPLYKLSANKWYWDYLLDVKAVEAGKAANNALWQVDKEVVDGGVNGAGWFTRFWARASGLWDKWVIDLAVNATAKITYWSSFIFRAVQTGLWQNYALLFAIGLFLILLLFIYPAILTTIKGFRR